MLKKNIGYFAKFCVTGGLGTITNLVVFYILVDVLHLNPTLSSCVCFLIAGTQNYFLNQSWTFRDQDEGAKLTITKWFFFMSASLVGLLLNIIVLNVLLALYSWWLALFPQAIGIVAGMVFNYVLSRFVVFKELKK